MRAERVAEVASDEVVASDRSQGSFEVRGPSLLHGDGSRTSESCATSGLIDDVSLVENELGWAGTKLLAGFPVRLSGQGCLVHVADCGGPKNFGSVYRRASAVVLRGMGPQGDQDHAPARFAHRRNAKHLSIQL